MKKLLLFILASFSICAYSFGQDFTIDELIKLRTETFPAFETFVHDKGYNLSHFEYDEKCSVYKNGSDVISYCHSLDNGFSYRNHVSIKFETDSKELYEKIKRSVEAGMTYNKTKMRKYRREHYVEHIYSNDKVVVHLYDIAYWDDIKPYYQIEVYSVYADSDGRARWDRE